MPITEIGFQSELFGLIVVLTIIGHSPGRGGYLNSDAHHVLGLKIRKINIFSHSWNLELCFGWLKIFFIFFRVNRIISLFDIKSS